MAKQTKFNIFTWCYRVFMYLVPGGVALWETLIKSLIDGNFTIMAKIGVSGIFVIAIILIIAVFFYGKHLNKVIEKITNQCIECMDNEKKKELITKKRKAEAKRDLFSNAVFVSIFVIAWLIVSCIEKGIVSMRGTLMVVVISMAIGLGFNGLAQWVKVKGGENGENKDTTNS